MNERFALIGLSVVSLLGLWLAPWAAFARATGARSTVLLLPNRVLDFSGRTEALPVAGLGFVLGFSVLLLAAVLIASFLKERSRYLVWLAAGAGLIITTAWGLANVQRAVTDVRLAIITQSITEALVEPRESIDVEALNTVLEEAPRVSIDATVLKSRQAGFTIRRLAYGGSGMGLAAFLAYVTGGLALFFGLRLFNRLGRTLDRILTLIAVPATSILLALLAAAFVILFLQETPVNGDIDITNWQIALAGRLEVLWYSYLTLFANSLGTVGGFAESLKFATPLIFTGLAVAFGFQAGLFNIGAPGQMVLGALFAMLAGLYLPGPSLIVLPLSVFAAALGGGIWGAIPGWLKARFGANEVINTILMNYIAASLLLFMLSSSNTFSAPALRILWLIGSVAVAAIILSLIPPVRTFISRSPRTIFAVLGVVVLIGSVIVGLPRADDRPVTFALPFKAPGSEPKSYALQETARLQQLPSLIGIDRETSFGETIVSFNLALLLGVIAVALAFFLLPLLRRNVKLWQRGLGALVFGGFIYAVAALFGLASVDTIIPPTNLNTSFFIAVGAAVFMQYFMWRTKWGYELRAVGAAPEAAEYGGASISRNTILAMTLSGAFAGLTACHYVLGGALEEYSLRQALPTSDGFDGIAVALLGGNTPIGVVLSAFLFGVLKNGGTILNVTFSGLTRDVVSMILALVVLFIAAKGFLPERITNPLRRQAYLNPDADSSGGPESPGAAQRTEAIPSEEES